MVFPSHVNTYAPAFGQLWDAEYIGVPRVPLDSDTIVKFTVAGALRVKKTEADPFAETSIVLLLTATFDIVASEADDAIDVVAVPTLPAASVADTVMVVVSAGKPLIVQVHVVAVGYDTRPGEALLFTVTATAAPLSIVPETA